MLILDAKTSNSVPVSASATSGQSSDQEGRYIVFPGQEIALAHLLH